MQSMKERYTDLAKWLMYSSDKSNEQLAMKLDSLGLEFRKSKGIDNINRAIIKAKNPKRGFLKTELEEEMLAAYLVDIFKLQRRKI